MPRKKDILPKKIVIEAEVDWSSWYAWEDLEEDRRKGGIPLPYGKKGVYIVKKKDSDMWLLVAWTNKSLGRMIQENLLHGRTDRPDSPASKLRDDKKDHSKLEILWGETDKPFCLWEYLVRKHVNEFSRLPKYIPKEKREK